MTKAQLEQINQLLKESVKNYELIIKFQKEVIDSKQEQIKLLEDNIKLLKSDLDARKNS